MISRQEKFSAPFAEQEPQRLEVSRKVMAFGARPTMLA